MKFNTRTLNLFQKIKEKLSKGTSLSPDEMQLQKWLRRMKHQIERRASYAARNAAYPYSSSRQNRRHATRFFPHNTGMHGTDRRTITRLAA